jgi:hypothetical protein
MFHAGLKLRIEGDTVCKLSQNLKDSDCTAQIARDSWSAHSLAQ